MLFERKLDPTTIAPKASTRYSVNFVGLVQHNGHDYLSCTDGRGLTMIRATMTESSGAVLGGRLIPVEAVVAARKSAKSTNEASISCDDDGITVKDAGQKFQYAEGTFPDVSRVVPDLKTPQVRLRIDAKLLMKLAKALGSEQVELTFDGEDEDGSIVANSPINITSCPGTKCCASALGSFAVLMPISKA
mgnify:CR=1 FL=1|tara:strand:- start:17708 stop:18277 length:570 start_codon:yes stop_codon:yes gene_type:complete